MANNDDEYEDKMGNNQERNSRADKVMKACGIGDKDDRDLRIRDKFHDHLEDDYGEEKDEMEYQKLLEVAKTFIRENYPNG